VGGYSWTDKPAKGKRRAKKSGRVKFDPNAPLATYPGFRMLPDGSSQIFVSISKKVDVKVRKARGRVTYILPHVNVGVRNNTNPLVTLHFNTPMSQARLLPDKQGALLIVELREQAELAHKIVNGPRGTMVLQVSLPRARRTYAGAAIEMGAGVSDPATGSGTGHRSATPNGQSGPKL
jgi:hypothetical protein